MPSYGGVIYEAENGTGDNWNSKALCILTHYSNRKGNGIETATLRVFSEIVLSASRTSDYYYVDKCKDHVNNEKLIEIFEDHIGVRPDRIENHHGIKPRIFFKEEDLMYLRMTEMI